MRDRLLLWEKNQYFVDLCIPIFEVFDASMLSEVSLQNIFSCFPGFH